MNRDMIRKAMSVAFVALAVAVLIFAILVAGRQRDLDSPGDWLIVISPVIAPLIGGLLSCLLYPSPKTIRPIWRGLLWGSFAGANGFLVFLAYSLFRHFGLISQDGTAYWGLLFLPYFWIGIPALMVGAIVGFGIGSIVSRTLVAKL